MCHTTVNAVHRAGLVDLELSTNNSAPALAHLLKEANCHFILARQDGRLPALDAILASALDTLAEQNWNITVVPWPEHSQLLQGPDLDLETDNSWLWPYDEDRPVAILHSSGTTGTYPKLRVYTEKPLAMGMRWGAYSLPNDPVGRASASGHLPQFHLTGWATQLASFSIGRIPSFYEYQEVPKAVNPKSWIKMVSDTNGGHTAVLPPMLAEVVAKDAALLKEFAACTTMV